MISTVLLKTVSTRCSLININKSSSFLGHISMWHFSICGLKLGLDFGLRLGFG